MLLISMIMALNADPAPAAPQAPGDLFAGLAGYCWRGETPSSRDTHCFTGSNGGKLVLDVHKLRTLDNYLVYEGVTVYRTDAATGKVSFVYYTSQADLVPGEASRDGNDLQVVMQMANGPVSQTWHINGNSYDVSSPMMPTTVRFKKVGQAPEGGL